MIIDKDKIEALRQVLAEDSRGGLFRRRRAARRLAQLAVRADGRGREPGPEEARAIVEGLVAGLESVHWGPHLTCRHALERIKDPQLQEAVCQVVIEQDLPRLNAIAVQGRYEPQDPASKAAYLFVLGRPQFYEAHDPEGKLLEQFYVKASVPLRDRLLGLARKRRDQCWVRLVMEVLRNGGRAAMSEVEEEVVVEAVAVLGAEQRWEELWAPGGKFLEKFYVGALPSLRDRILWITHKGEDRRWVRLIAGLLRSQGGAAMSKSELTAAAEAVEVLSAERCWEELWALVLNCPLPLSWRGSQELAEGGWQPQEDRAAACWGELVAAMRVVKDLAAATGIVGLQKAVPLGHMAWEDLELMQQFIADKSLSPEQQEVARYVTAVLRYRLEADGL